MSRRQHLCVACGAPATAWCGRCKISQYCSQSCQASHWRSHKGECRLAASPIPPHEHSLTCNHAKMKAGAVLAAAQAGDAAALQLALAKGGSTEETDDAGLTALAWAAYSGHATLVRMLLAAGADPAKTDPKGCSPLRMAVASTDMSLYVVATLLADPRVDVNSRETTVINFGGTPLHLAAHSVWECSAAMIGLFLAEPRVDVNAADARGSRPFDRAIHTGNSEAVRAFLADPRVDISCREDGRRTWLHVAASGGDAEMVRVLLADPRLASSCTDRDSRGWTALDLARGAEPPPSPAAEDGRPGVAALLEAHMCRISS